MHQFLPSEFVRTQRGEGYLIYPTFPGSKLGSPQEREEVLYLHRGVTVLRGVPTYIYLRFRLANETYPYFYGEVYIVRDGLIHIGYFLGNCPSYIFPVPRLGI